MRACRETIDGDDRLAEQVPRRAVPAVVVARRQFDGEVDGVEFFIHRDLAPHSGVAGVDPRLFFPRVVPELAELRDRVEDPHALPGLHIEAADVALLVLLALRHATRQVRGADDDRVLRDDRRRVQADLAGDGIHRLVVILFEVNDAVRAERRDRAAVLRVERDELVAGRDVDDAVVAAAVGVVREAAS